MRVILALSLPIGLVPAVGAVLDAGRYSLYLVFFKVGFGLVATLTGIAAYLAVTADRGERREDRTCSLFGRVFRLTAGSLNFLMIAFAITEIVTGLSVAGASVSANVM